MEENMKQLFGDLDSLLGSTDIKDVTAEGAGFEELTDGYYLSEVEKAEIKESKSSHVPMVALQFKVVEDGLDINPEGMIEKVRNTKNRKIFIYYPLKDEQSVKRFIADMLKFEGSEPGKPLLDKEYFANSELLATALDVLTGSRIYIQVSCLEKEDGSISSWRNLISWKRVEALGLNEEMK